MPPQSDVRLYTQRASYELTAALDIFSKSPVSHVAFVHPGDARREATVMNLPLILAIVHEGEGEHEEDYAVYLHTHKHSGVHEAVDRGLAALTATTTIIDGMVFSPTAADHSLDYRSATLHLSQPTILSDNEHALKQSSLGAVINAVTGYDRLSTVGTPDDASVRRAMVIRCKIAKVSCKQRCGGWKAGQEPEIKEDGEEGFKGVIPCWTQWGTLEGYGKDRKELQEIFEERSEQGRAYAQRAIWAEEEAKIDGLGQRRKT